MPQDGPGDVTPSFSVVIPAFNEEAGIDNCITEVTAALGRLPHSCGLIVVDDGSGDSTPTRLRAHEADPAVTVVRHPTNLGYGAALMTGVKEAARQGRDYVVFMDSDLTNDPRDLAGFVAEMERGTDVIKASRYIPGGGVEDVPRWRVAVSVIGNGVARNLYGLPVRDCTNGFRAVRTSLLEAVAFEERGFAIILEELYRLRGSAASYAEVPVQLTNRREGLRPSTFSYTPRALLSFLKWPTRAAVDRLRPRDRR